MNKRNLSKRETPCSLSFSASCRPATKVIEASSPYSSEFSATSSFSASLGEVVSVDPFNKATSRLYSPSYISAGSLSTTVTVADNPLYGLFWNGMLFSRSRE